MERHCIQSIPPTGIGNHFRCKVVHTVREAMPRTSGKDVVVIKVV